MELKVRVRHPPFATLDVTIPDDAPSLMTQLRRRLIDFEMERRVPLKETMLLLSPKTWLTLWATLETQYRYLDPSARKEGTMEVFGVRVGSIYNGFVLTKCSEIARVVWEQEEKEEKDGSD